MGITINTEFANVEVDVWHNKTITFPVIRVLMIHGMFSSGWYFDSWAKFLCEKGFVVYVIRNLHKGENLTKVDFYTYLGKSIEVVRSICAMTGGKIIIIGHSMGGLIAQKIAEINPHLVDCLVLVASAPPKGISAMSLSVARAMAKHWFPLVFNLPLKIDKKSALRLIFNWAGDYERKEQIFRKFVPESSKVAKQLAFSEVPVDEKKVICKILIVAGMYDRLLPYRIQFCIGNKYESSCYMHTLAGHMPMLEEYSERNIKDIYHWILIY